MVITKTFLEYLWLTYTLMVWSLYTHEHRKVVMASSKVGFSFLHEGNGRVIGLVFRLGLYYE